MKNPVMTVHTQFRMDGSQRIELGRGCWVWCPGCDEAHHMNVVGEDGSRDNVTWEWDGNLETPTFSPSILVHNKHHCHSFLRSGRWEFLGDCQHALAGQTVDMVPVPDWLCQPPYDARTNEPEAS